MNDYRAYVECDYNSIYHHGIKGMKWGVRRFQNEDRSLTPEGQRRYGKLLDQRRKAHEATISANEATKKQGPWKNPGCTIKLLGTTRSINRIYTLTNGQNMKQCEEKP